METSIKIDCDTRNMYFGEDTQETHEIITIIEEQDRAIAWTLATKTFHIEADIVVVDIETHLSSVMITGDRMDERLSPNLHLEGVVTKWVYAESKRVLFLGYSLHTTYFYILPVELSSSGTTKMGNAVYLEGVMDAFDIKYDEHTNMIYILHFKTEDDNPHDFSEYDVTDPMNPRLRTTRSLALQHNAYESVHPQTSLLYKGMMIVSISNVKKYDAFETSDVNVFLLPDMTPLPFEFVLPSLADEAISMHIDEMYTDPSGQRLFAVDHTRRMFVVYDIRDLTPNADPLGDTIDVINSGSVTYLPSAENAGSDWSILFPTVCSMLVVDDTVYHSYKLALDGVRFLNPEEALLSQPIVDPIFFVDSSLAEDMRPLFNHWSAQSAYMGRGDALYSTDMWMTGRAIYTSDTTYASSKDIFLTQWCLSTCGDGIKTCSEDCDVPHYERNVMENGCCEENACKFKPSGKVCNSHVGSTDCVSKVPQCSGTSSACPMPVYRPEGVACTGGADPDCSVSKCSRTGTCVVMESTCSHAYRKQL
jgi:hypothetical protein